MTLIHELKQTEQSRYKIAQETGIAESILSRFVNGKTELSLANADKLLSYFSFTITRKAGKKK